MSQWPGPECGLTEDEWDDPLGMRRAMKKFSEILDQFIAKNPEADQRAAVGYVMKEMGGKVNPNTIGEWFRVRRT